MNYGKLVPQAAQRFLKQANNISNSTGYEVTVYEPRKDDTHLEGIFYVGIIVEEQPDSLLYGLEFLEIRNKRESNRNAYHIFQYRPMD